MKSLLLSLYKREKTWTYFTSFVKTTLSTKCKQYLKENYIRSRGKDMSKASNPSISLNALLDSTRDSIQKAIKMELAQYNMSQSQVKTLHMISNSEELLTLNQIAELSIRELNSVTTLINRMGKKGLVEKVKKPGDPRTYVALTEKGRDIYENTVTERSIMLIFDALDEKEKEELRVLLSKLQTKARNLLGLDYKPPFLLDD